MPDLTKPAPTRQAGRVVSETSCDPAAGNKNGAWLCPVDRDKPQHVEKPSHFESFQASPAAALLRHGRELVIPYDMSDCATSYATMPLDEVLAAME